MLADTLLKDGDYKTIREMLGRINRIIPGKRILAELDSDKEIRYWSCHDLYEEVMNLGDGMIDAGLSGNHIAIVSENCIHYIVCDITISSGVGVVTPIDANAPEGLLAQLLDKCDADAVVCDLDHLSKVLTARERCPRLKTIITHDARAVGTLFYGDLVKRGKELSTNSVFRRIELDPDAPAKILFTSGTTGANKGVVLTHTNLAANMVNCMDAIHLYRDNTSMSVLPMHHAMEMNTHIMCRIGCGRLTYINGNMRNMLPNLKIFRPDLITVVPMVVNAFYKNIWATAKKTGKEKKLRKGIRLNNFLRKFGIDRSRKLFKDIYAQFGGNLGEFVCGGSMLNPVVIKGMRDLGFRIQNGYGITECGPLVSIYSETWKEHINVGKPCPQLQAKLVNVDGNGVGELCIKGPSVAKGYYNDPEATAAVFGKDGFFNTGDSARIDRDGRIFLVGRKKNTIILQNGKNVCPEEVENILETNLPYADEVAVYQADYKGKETLCAGLYISDVTVRSDRDRIAADMKKINALLPPYKQIAYVELVCEPYEKTSTKKIKRTTLPSRCSGDGLIIL